MSQLPHKSEWMQWQKHADVMAPDKEFHVVQSGAGDPLFFSIGTDSVLYVSHELATDYTGWKKFPLSNDISSHHNGAKVAAKVVKLSQDPQTLAIHIALAVTVNNSDYLYVSYNNNLAIDDPTKPASDKISWTSIPFDDPKGPGDHSKVVITDVQLLSLPALGQIPASETCIVDILRDPTGNSGNSLINRYYISPDNSQKWQPHYIGSDLDSKAVQSCMGRRANDLIAGIYTFGTIGGSQKLQYSMAYNPYADNPLDTPPSIVYLSPPASAGAIASSANPSGYSNLFVAGAEGIFVYIPTSQQHDKTPTLISSHDISKNSKNIYAESRLNMTYVWGVNPKQDLFYISCAAGQEDTPTAWSTPVVLANNVSAYSPYAAIKTDRQVIFAHTDVQEIVQLSCDHITTEWTQRSILLPSTDISSMYESQGFSTRIQPKDKNNFLLPNKKIDISSVSPVAVYINDKYHLLSPTASTFETDSTGSLSILQPAETLSAVCYNVNFHEEPLKDAIPINPAEKSVDKLAALTSDDAFSTAKFVDKDGKTNNFLPGDASADDRKAAAKAFQQLAAIRSDLPKDGSKQKKKIVPNTIMAFALHANIADDRSLHVDHLQDAAHTAALDNITSLDSVFVKIGDFFIMLKNSIVEGLQSLLFDIKDGFWHVMCAIGDTVYEAVLDCASALAHTYEWVLGKLKVAWGSVKAFAGFIFGWDDILRTHDVLRSFSVNYIKHAISGIATVRNAVASTFDGLEAKLNSMGDLDDPGKKTGDYGKESGSQDDGDPQSHWALQHFKSNLKSTEMPSMQENTDVSPFDTILKRLKVLIEAEEETMKAFAKEFNEKVIKEFPQLTPIQLVKRIAILVAKLVVKGTKELVTVTLDIAQIAAEAVVSLLVAPIQIPILSKIYKTITKGKDLSIIDVVCLIAAIPTTIVCKLALNRAPFADNSSTTALIQAQDWDAFQKVLKGGDSNNLHIARADSTNTVAFAAIDNQLLHDFAIASRALVATTTAIAVTLDTIRFLTLDKIDWIFWIRLSAIATTALSTSAPITGAITTITEWQTDLNITLLGLRMVKVIIDASPLRNLSSYRDASPYISMVLSASMIAPVVGNIIARHDKDSDYVNLGVGIAGMAYGIVMPLCIGKKLGYPTDEIVWGGGVVLAGSGVILSVANTVLLAKGM